MIFKFCPTYKYNDSFAQACLLVINVSQVSEVTNEPLIISDVVFGYSFTMYSFVYSLVRSGYFQTYVLFFIFISIERLEQISPIHLYNALRQIFSRNHGLCQVSCKFD